MGILKKCGAILILLSFLTALTVFPVNIAFAEDAEYYTDLLSVFGIYDAEDYMDLTNENINREELASILSVFYGINDKNYPVKTEFIDVPEYWASGHILTMVNNGIMSGYEDGLFRPTALVTAVDAMKIFVSMTGYKIIADINGGYPDGYVFAASQIGLFKGVEISDREAPITKGQFTRMLYNALLVDLYEQTGFSTENQGYSSTKGKTLLTERLDIYETNGIVLASTNTSLDFGETPGKNKVRVGNTVYKCGFDTYPYLGFRIKGYYRQSEEDMIGEILYLEDKYDGENALKVDAHNIEALTGRTLSYEKGDDIKIASIPADAIVVYNGKRDSYTALATLCPKQGSITLSDANADGKYEYVIIASFIDFVVSSVANENGVFTIGSENGKNPLVINSEDYGIYVSVNDMEKSIPISSIRKNDVLSVMADSVDLSTMQIKEDSTVYVINRSSEKVTGTLTAVLEDNVVSVDGTLYQLSGAYDFKKYPLSVGESYTFYINYFGDISLYFDMSVDGIRYGILQTYNYKTQLNEKCSLRIFDESGSFVVFELADNVYLDGNKKKSFDECIRYLKDSSFEFTNVTGIVQEHSGVWQLIKYKTNSNKKIDTIDTILPDTVASENELKYSGKTNPSQYTYHINGGIYVLPDEKANIPAHSFLLTDTMAGFQIGGDLNNTESYGLYFKSQIKSAKEVDIKIFDAGKMNIPKALIGFKKLSEIDIQTYNESMCIEKIQHKLDENGDAAVYISGINFGEGTVREIKLKNENVYLQHDVEPGDVIQWVGVTGKEVGNIRVLIRHDGIGETRDSETTTKSQGGGFNFGYRFSFGKATAMDNDYLCQRFEAVENDLYDYTETNFLNKLKYVYRFNSKSGTLEPSSVSEIRTVENHGEELADYIACTYKNGMLVGIVFYR